MVSSVLHITSQVEYTKKCNSTDSKNKSVKRMCHVVSVTYTIPQLLDVVKASTLNSSPSLAIVFDSTVGCMQVVVAGIRQV